MKMLPFLILAALLLSSCRAGLQVQQAKDAPDESAYCNIDESTGLLLVTITNQGQVDAPASVAAVRFHDGKEVKMPTPAIPAGESITLEGINFSYDDNCTEPNCNFTITADAQNAVLESNEENNSAQGFCPVPVIRGEVSGAGGGWPAYFRRTLAPTRKVREFTRSELAPRPMPKYCREYWKVGWVKMLQRGEI